MGCDNESLTHDVSLGTDGNQTVNVLADGNENLAGHVAALLGARGLVLNVNTGSTLLNEELGELHDGGETAMAGIGISNDGTEVVDVGELGALALGDAETLLALLAVVEELGHEQVANLVGDSSLKGGIIPVSLGELHTAIRGNDERRRKKCHASRVHTAMRCAWAGAEARLGM